MKPKLKNLKYEVPGIDSDRPAKECLQAISIGIAFPLFVSVIIYLADKIDSIDHFGQAFFSVTLIIVLLSLVIFKR